MRSQHDFSTPIPKWASPWAAGWSDMRVNSPIQSERQRRAGADRGDRVLVRPPPPSLRRIRTIGVAASSAAAAVWVAAIAWWQIGA